MTITKNGLFKIGFIESAKHKYSEIDLNNNTLLLGTNNVGKTTILKALLYFYVGSPAKLGISKNKLSFKDYYLPTMESKIFYFYKKDNKYIMVLLFNDANTIKHKFFLFNEFPKNIKNLFYKELDEERLELLDISEIEDKLKMEYYCEVSPKLESGDYKRVLYGDIDKNLNTSKPFILFDDKKMKNNAYENFSKLIENIFKADKIDSEFFLKSLLETIENNEEPTLNVNKLVENSNRFSKQHMEWELYQKAKPTIKKLVETYEEYQKELKELEKNYFNVEHKIYLLPKELNDLKDKKTTDEVKLKKIKTDKDETLNKLVKERDEIKKNEAQIEIKIKNIENLIKAYKEKNIEDRIHKFKVELPQLKDKSLSIEKQIKLLTTKAENLQIEYEKQVNALETKKLKDKEQQTKKVSDLNKTILEVKNKNQQELNTSLDKIKTNNYKVIEELNKEINLYELEKQKLELIKLVPFKNTKEANEFQNELDSLNKKSRKNEEDINKINNKINSSKDREGNLNKDKDKDIKYIENSFNKELDNLKKDENKIEKLLNPILNNDNSTDTLSLNDKIRNSDLYDTYVYFLNEEVLESHLDITFKDKNTGVNNIFEFIPNIDIKSNKLKDKLDGIQNKIKGLITQYNKDIKDKEEEYDKLILKETKDRRKYLKELNEIEKNQTDLKYKIKQLEKNYKDKENIYIEKQNELKKQNEKDIEKYREKIVAKREKIKEIKQDEVKELEKVKTIFKTNLENTIKPLNNEISNIQKILDKIETLYIENQAKIKKEFNEQLKKNGVDTDKISLLEKEKREIDKEIEIYQKFEKDIILYEKDIIEINKLDEYKLNYDKIKDQEKEIDKKIKESTKDFDAKIKELENSINSIISSIKFLNSEQNKIKELQNDRFYLYCQNNFKLDKEIIENPLYETNYKLFELIERLRNSAETLRDIENNMRDLLSKSIMVTLFELEDSFLNFKRIRNNNQDSVDVLATTEYIKENIYNKNDFLEKHINKALTIAAKSNIEIIKNDYGSILRIKKELDKNIARINKQTNDINITAISSIKLGVEVVIENNTILKLYNDIYREVVENGFQTEFQLNLFEDNSKKLLNLLKELDKELKNLKDKNEKISFMDAFNLSFRVIQNGQDSGKRMSLDDSGSHGTDKIIKIILYTSMLNLYKDNADTNIHIVFDEIGTLDVKNIKELMDFINKKGFVFFNAIPNKLAEEYFQNIYYLEKNGDYTEVTKILEEEVEF